MSISAELIMRDDTDQKFVEPDSCLNQSDNSADSEEFCEETFAFAFCAAACSDDAELLASISKMFALHPTKAWETVDRICEEKAREATIATQTGNYAAAQAAIEQHHALAMVYSKLITARVERLSAQL